MLPGTIFSGISEIVNQLDNNYIFGILNEEQFNFSLEEKQQIIKKTYKILKNKGNFNKDDFIKKFSKIKIKKFKINKKILEQWDEEIEKNKPIYKFINNEDYSKNIEGFINDCRKELEDIKLDKKYIDIVVNYIEKLKKEKQESSKLKQISNILKNISSEIEEKSEFKKISNCLTAYEELKI